MEKDEKVKWESKLKISAEHSVIMRSVAIRKNCPTIFNLKEVLDM
jgi:hypothetical protein